MDNFFYFSSIRSVTVQLLHIFSDMSIVKYNDENEIIKQIKVPLKYSSKEKFYWWIFDKKQEKMLPMMSLHLTSFSYASDRATIRNVKLYKNIESKDEIVDNRIIEILRPTPYKFSYQMNIATVYLSEADQILEQILPFFDPFIMMRVSIPDAFFDYDAKVILTSISPEISDDLSDDSMRIVKWNLDFDVDGFIFKPISEGKLIKTISIPYYMNPVEIGFIDGTQSLELTDKINNNGDKTYIGGNDKERPYQISAHHGRKDELGQILSTYEIYKDQKDDNKKN